MNFLRLSPAWLRATALCLGLLLPVLALRAAEPATAPAASAEVIVGKEPMRFTTESRRLSGQLEVARELLGPDTPPELVYTIVTDAQCGQVGLAGGEEEDFLQNKTAHSGYFAYQPREGYVGPDSFTYTVRNETTGLVFRNTVEIEVKPPAALVLERIVVKGDRERALTAQPVTLRTRPNAPVTGQLTNHEDFMRPADRSGIVNPKVAFALDDKAKPQHGTATLDRATGKLTYAPNPDFIGEDKFGYYTVDENNPALGAENSVVVSVEPIRDFRKMSVDRSTSRQVDLVFVINNSSSMAPHQQRIAESLRRFRRLFDEKGLDYRIGVLTTDFVNVDPDRPASEQEEYKEVRGVKLDKAGQPVLDRSGRPQTVTKRVASNGNLVTLPVMAQPWVTPRTPDAVFAELVKVGTNGDSNRTAFTAVYNFVANYSNHLHSFLRPDATTVVVFFMDEEETRLATWKDLPGGERKAEWVEHGKLPALLAEYNRRNPAKRQTLDSYINFWVLRPFIIVKGNQRGKVEMDAVVSPDNVSHRRAAELTGGSVLNIESDFSAPLAALGDRIADTVAVALDPVGPGATFYRKSLRVLVDGQEVPADPVNGYVYDKLTHSIRFQGAAKKQAFAAKIEITYEEHR